VPEGAEASGKALSRWTSAARPADDGHYPDERRLPSLQDAEPSIVSIVRLSNPRASHARRISNSESHKALE
jgi:hypothetical protein